MLLLHGVGRIRKNYRSDCQMESPMLLEAKSWTQGRDRSQEIVLRTQKLEGPRCNFEIPPLTHHERCVEMLNPAKGSGGTAVEVKDNLQFFSH